MEEKTKHLIVISFDGISTKDFDYIKELNNFKSILKEASFSAKVYSVYPTLTYPAHTTIITGKNPVNHGIINNTLLQPKRKSPDWYWNRKYIKSETIYDLASKHDMKVAALMWPVTAKANIKYNMPEIFANRPWHNQILVSLLNGSKYFQYSMNKKYGKLRKGLKQPYLDNFTHKVLLDTIINKQLNLILVHYTDLDATRHMYGFEAKETKEALVRHDIRLGEIIQTLKKEGIYEESTIIILGDHSSLDEDKVININVLFKDKGYLIFDKKGRVKSYRAIAKSCDGSSYIYFKDNSVDFSQEVKKVLEEFNLKNNCIEEIYNGASAGKLGADINCGFMLEARKGYYFLDDIEGEVIKDVSSSSEFTKSTHGYSPYKKDYTTIFIAAGKGIKKGVQLEEMNLVDEGPTIGKLLGLDLKDIDGRVIEEFMK
ncbi:MAG TPA: ectonucleotide pyrophosphatase/phosphodiesterase [Clostridiaceae bacterium]